MNVNELTTGWTEVKESLLEGLDAGKQEIVAPLLENQRKYILNETAAAGATTADITGLGLTVPMGAITVLAGYSKDSKKASALDERMALGATYALSKRTTVGADVFKQDQAGGSTGFVIRARHTF